MSQYEPTTPGEPLPTGATTGAPATRGSSGVDDTTGAPGTDATTTGPATSAAPTPDDGPDPLRFSRTSGAFAGLVVVLVLILLLVVFIFQNTKKVPIRFLWFDGNAPLAAALLIATAAGMAIVALVGGLRILQLRHRVKRDKKQRRQALKG